MKTKPIFQSFLIPNRPFYWAIVIASLSIMTFANASANSLLLTVDPDYQAVINEANAQGYILPSADDQNIQNQVVMSLKASGVWQQADVIYYFKGSGSKEFKLINWKNPSGPKAVEVNFGGALTWSGTGVMGDGLATINTNFNTGAGSPNYTQNNAGFYVYVSRAYTSKHGGMVGNDSPLIDVSMRNTVQRQFINSDGSLPPVFDFSGTGLFGIARNSTTSQVLSVNSITTTNSLNSGPLENSNFTLFGYGSVLTSEFTRFDGEISYVLIGADMSSYLSVIETAFSISTPDQSDTQAPTPAILASTAKSDTTVDLSWSGAMDNVGITGYRIFKDGTLEANLANVSSHQVSGLSGSTSYQFTVRAFDAAGNESANSNVLNITTDAPSGGGNSGNGTVWSETNSVASYDGQVAVGRSTVPTGYKLAVEGKIRSREVRVDQDNWPDYVFEDDYDLPSIEEVERFIKTKGHLLNIPSAQEIEENGVPLGKMDKLLLQKIEELTLYIIEMKKEIRILERRIEEK
nr:fibronectin type III domain-containing protein [Allomuricauda sp.]